MVWGEKGTFSAHLDQGDASVPTQHLNPGREGTCSTLTRATQASPPIIPTAPAPTRDYQFKGHYADSVPAALAVMIGHQVNAMSAITLYHFMEKDRRYVAVCTLGKQEGAV